MLKTYKLIEKYWLSGPVWLPFLIVSMVPIVLAAKPGMINYVMGTRVDFSQSRIVRGRFARRVSDLSPYKFTTSSGNVLRLACDRHERFVTCLDKKGVFEGTMDVTLAPSTGSNLNVADGIILQVSTGHYVLVSRSSRFDQIFNRRPVTAISIFLDAITLITDLILFVAAAFVAVGFITSTKRIFGMMALG